MTETADALPTEIRRLDNDDATRLVHLVEAYDELQTVLRCCERLVKILGDDPTAGNDTGVEALWTLALLSYARAFTERDTVTALSEDDIADPAGADAAKPEPGESLRWHRVLLHLRDYHAGPESNPRETYTVGLALGEDGLPNAVAVTSVPAPLVDAGAVRQAGALAYPLCTVLDSRIGTLQEQILAAARELPRDRLEAMDVIEVVAPG